VTLTATLGMGARTVGSGVTALMRAKSSISHWSMVPDLLTIGASVALVEERFAVILRRDPTTEPTQHRAEQQAAY
jgi:hypothetical protein